MFIYLADSVLSLFGPFASLYTRRSALFAYLTDPWAICPIHAHTYMLDL